MADAIGPVLLKTNETSFEGPAVTSTRNCAWPVAEFVAPLPGNAVNPNVEAHAGGASAAMRTDVVVSASRYFICMLLCCACPGRHGRQELRGGGAYPVE